VNFRPFSPHLYKTLNLIYNDSMNDDQSYTPDWVPPDAVEGFAIKIKKGIKSQYNATPTSKGGKTSPGKRKMRPQLDTDDYVKGVLNNDKTILARTITLIESNSPEHYGKAREVMAKLLPHTGKSLRIGITGVPGAGKSTLIESFGSYLIDQGFKVAVLAVDPSSSITRGSILGDKTRMEKLSKRDDCFIRPSPSGGTPGGVTRKSRETILVCEAAGYDVILIETVGVGQSEITVRSMVDFFLLVLIAGAGDELQAIKKGIMEIADAIIVNKADGNNINSALNAKNEYSIALKYLPPSTKGWETKAYTCSALTGDGISRIWKEIKKFEEFTRESGFFYERRKNQSVEWVFSMIENSLRENFYSNPQIQAQLPVIKDQVLNGSMLPTTAADKLLGLVSSTDTKVQKA
jgi:LAO/AO transport system kinase